MKILLLGPHGQVGWELQRSLAPLGEVIARHRQNGGDLSDLDALAATVRQIGPQVIVNAAAYTAVDQAEREPELARRVNADAPAVLAREAAACGAALVHYSTDYVFDGSGDAPWREDDAPAPLSVYGQTKLDGERAVEAALRPTLQAGGSGYLILRTSWVYAARGGNFAKTMLRLARERERMTVVADQWGAPTGAELLADATALALARLLRDSALSGLYHLTASGTTTWFDYARLVIEEARCMQPAHDLKVREVAPIDTADWPTPAQRPLNSRLDCRKVQAAFDLRLPPWQDGVRRMIREIL
ncbi:MAG: dTDP-4-dehydrorhamnose reductase [Burkholderiaceae bacterium]|jgi:dTDP-4-dehydrorhamnose reductase|nr:dTDP-4-dehydrorhamnose reductase [Burkholderiaceae bacterium]